MSSFFFVPEIMTRLKWALCRHLPKHAGACRLGIQSRFGLGITGLRSILHHNLSIYEPIWPANGVFSTLVLFLPQLLRVWMISYFFEIRRSTGGCAEPSPCMRGLRQGETRGYPPLEAPCDLGQP